MSEKIHFEPTWELPNPFYKWQTEALLVPRRSGKKSERRI